MKQIHLESYDQRGKFFMVWLDDINEKHIGKRIKLKDDNEWWIVREVFSHNLDKNDVRKTWHVGGL